MTINFNIAERIDGFRISLIAVAGHNVLEGSRQLMKLCKAEGMGCIAAVEMDCLDNGADIHVLGYGVDLENKDFIAFIKRNREMLDRISAILIEKMSADYPSVSAAGYARFTYDSRGGGCKAIRGAGGRAVLAHPGEVIGTSDREAFERELKRLADMGLDGIECHYPSHTPEAVG
jgi:3',5'-nucleoside bisphosphate phosphatase